MFKKPLLIVGLFVILAAIPLTVFLSQQQQEIRQRAAEAQPPTASITGPSTGAVGQNLTYAVQYFAVPSPLGSSATVFVSRQDNNTFNNTSICLEGIFTDSTGRKWCAIGKLSGATGSFGFTPEETGTYVVTVNAYANSTQAFTADKATECTGNPFGLNTTQQAQWSDCGPNDNIQLTVSAAPTSPPTPPTASLSGPSNGTVGQALSYSAQVVNGGSLSIFASRQDNAQFTCAAPGRSFTDSSGRYWCILAEIPNTTSGTTTFTPPTAGTYVVLVNGYANANFTFTSDKNTECTGNHFGLNATQQAQWSDCGSSSSITVTVAAPLPPAPTNPAASCPAPGTSANFSWTGVSGAGSYTAYAFDTTVSPTIDWSLGCGSGNRTECQRVTGTSTSSNRFTAGHTYQWFVFACSGNTNNCSQPVSTSFTCTAAPTPLPADVDRNGCVGIVDFNLWLRAYQTGTAQGGTSPDINGDGRVDLLDFNAWYNAMRSPSTKLCG